MMRARARATYQLEYGVTAADQVMLRLDKCGQALAR